MYSSTKKINTLYSTLTIFCDSPLSLLYMREGNHKSYYTQMLVQSKTCLLNMNNWILNVDKIYDLLKSTEK